MLISYTLVAKAVPAVVRIEGARRGQWRPIQFPHNFKKWTAWLRKSFKEGLILVPTMLHEPHELNLVLLVVLIVFHSQRLTRSSSGSLNVTENISHQYWLPYFGLLTLWYYYSVEYVWVKYGIIVWKNRSTLCCLFLDYRNLNTSSMCF